jgi:SRSO17 transposase
LHAVWEDCFRTGLTRPGFANLVVVLTGWTLTRGSHAITEALVMTDVARRRPWAAFHRFFSRGAWDPDKLGLQVFERMQRHLDGAIRVLLDDTIAPKKGAQVFGIGCHVDAVRSTKAHRVFVFGHCWVVLAVLVRVPFSTRMWALPILFRLYRNLKECEKRGAAYKKKTELAREMLDVLVKWAAGRRVEVAADAAYCNDTVTRDLPDNVVLFGAMRPDAVLTELPSASQGSAGGRPRKRGRTLRKPEKLAADGRTPWQTVSAMLYGKKTKVRYKMMLGQWYRATGVRLLRVVVIECTEGRLPIRVFFSTDASLDVVTILESYAGRWAIEVFFRDAKQLLGFADSQARKEEAVLRMAPMIGMLYSTLVLWFAEGTHTTAVATPPCRPWYPHKRGLAFSDVLRAAQRTLANVDVLDLANDLSDLHEPNRARTTPGRNHPRLAA